MTLTRRDLDEVAGELEAALEPRIEYRPRYNVAPTDAHPLVRLVGDRRVLGLGRWGFAGGPKARLLINARAETAPFRPAFRDAFRHRRCLVPADGFYEWRKDPAGRHPLWLHGADGRLLLLAGLWQDEGDGPRFVVLTTEPNAVVRPIHDRMPAILSPAEARAWLHEGDRALLHPAAEDVLVATPVSPRVNSVANDDPGCLAPVDGRAGQLGLFG